MDHLFVGLQRSVFQHTRFQPAPYQTKDTRISDPLVLEASPLLDIRNTRRIALVMQDGRFVHCVLARLSTSCPE
jgi:hypothetical protein